jgi:hypothetical protein
VIARERHPEAVTAERIEVDDLARIVGGGLGSAAVRYLELLDFFAVAVERQLVRDAAMAKMQFGSIEAGLLPAAASTELDVAHC